MTTRNEPAVGPPPEEASVLVVATPRQWLTTFQVIQITVFFTLFTAILGGSFWWVRSFYLGVATEARAQHHAAVVIAASEAAVQKQAHTKAMSTAQRKADREINTLPQGLVSARESITRLESVITAAELAKEDADAAKRGYEQATQRTQQAEERAAQRVRDAENKVGQLSELLGEAEKRADQAERLVKRLQKDLDDHKRHAAQKYRTESTEQRRRREVEEASRRGK